MQIKDSKDFVQFISDTMEAVRRGDVTAPAGNAIANLGGKILQMINLEMKALNNPKLQRRHVLQIEAQVGMER